MLALGASAVLFIVLNMSPQIAKYNPASLVDLPLRLISGAAMMRHVLPVLCFTLVGSTLFIVLAVIVFSKRKKNMIRKIIILVTAALLCLAATVFIGEEMPRRIRVSRHVITEEIIVGEGTQWELHGLLTLPINATGPVPAVVLVHGSGPNDMDETIFDNKPFRDIAEHLSSNGIAVIRYNKRTLTHGMKLAEMNPSDFTVWEETIEDAILATRLLKADRRIDETRVYILGHSLGGMLAPRIHEMGGDYAGLILFAGSPRFLLDISKDQATALAAVTEDREERAAILEMNRLMINEFELVLTLSGHEVQNTHFDILGNMGYYWKDLYLNPVAEFLENITVPILVMHPEDDLQVTTEADFALYKELLAGRTNVTFKLYPGLNHLFMPSTGRNISQIMDEYKIKATVDSQVLIDIVEWIKAGN